MREGTKKIHNEETEKTETNEENKTLFFFFLFLNISSSFVSVSFVPSL